MIVNQKQTAIILQKNMGGFSRQVDCNIKLE